jgi:hypothetical protein
MGTTPRNPKLHCISTVSYFNTLFVVPKFDQFCKSLRLSAHGVLTSVIMKSTVFRVPAPCISAHGPLFGGTHCCSTYRPLLSGFLLDLFFGPEDGGGVFLLSIEFSPNCMALGPRRPQFSLLRSRVCYTGRNLKLKTKLNSVPFSPQANYTDRATSACRRS